jgi:hypothetical protein
VEGRLGRSQASQVQPSGKKKWRYGSKLFEKNCLKYGAMWHVDPLLDSDSEMDEYTAAVARQRSANNNRGMVFSAQSIK